MNPLPLKGGAGCGSLRPSVEGIAAKRDVMNGPYLCFVLMGVSVVCSVTPVVAPRAATVPPPLLDITRQCDQITHRNATAMSECVVQESEARAEVLQKWERFSNGDAQRCIKLAGKARKYPYTTMAKCLAEPAASPGVAPTAPVATKRKPKLPVVGATANGSAR